MAQGSDKELIVMTKDVTIHRLERAVNTPDRASSRGDISSVKAWGKRRDSGRRPRMAIITQQH